mgnify:CR=1 FL=1
MLRNRGHVRWDALLSQTKVPGWYFYDEFDGPLNTMAENVLEDYAIEGISAFLEKRDPNWDESNE